MTAVEHLAPGAIASGEAGWSVKAAEITFRGREGYEAEERALAVLDSIEVKVFGSRSCRFGDTAMALVVVSDGGAAREALEAAGLECQKIASVLVVLATDGRTKALLPARLARTGVTILYCYSLWMASGEDCLVLRTTDDELALRILTGGQITAAA